MRILDLDLDVFVTPIESRHRDERLDDDMHDVWSLADVEKFIEERCGLSSQDPTPGGFFEEHDEIFDFIKERVASSQLEIPFHLVHVDAHADMGLGQFGSVKYLTTELMQSPVAERASPERGSFGLNRGTIVLFMVAQEWLSKLDYIHHPDDGKDFREIFLDYDVDTDEFFFQIPRCSADDVEKSMDKWATMMKGEKGPRIPFSVVSIHDFQPTTFDLVLATRSPGFTPPKADAIFELISKYVKPV